MKQLPCFFADDMSEEQRIAFRIADNRVAESDLDKDIVRDEIVKLKEFDFDPIFTGFDEKEIGKLTDVSAHKRTVKGTDEKEKDVKKCPECGSILKS